MKILNLHIQKFRGIVDLVLNFNGENAVIFGPNGSGKSAVVDAVDFLLHGEVSRLTGEGTGDVSTAKHGPHIGSQPEEAKITATIQSITGKVFSVERTVVQKDRVTIDPIYSSEFGAMVTYAQSGAHCLARRELLRYILTTPSTRSQQIQTLLNISDTRTVRDGFAKLKKTAASNLKDASDSLKRHSADFRTNVGATADDQLLGRINSLRAVLGGGALTSLDECSFTNGLLYSDTKENAEIANCIRSLADLVIYTPTLRPALQEKLQNVQDTVKKIENENSSIENINYIALIKSGLDLLDGTGRCPLCLHEWASEVELRQILQERKEKSETLSTLLDTYQNDVDTLLNEILTYKSKIGTLPQQLIKWDNGCAAELNNEIESITSVSFQENNSYKNFSKDCSDEDFELRGIYTAACFIRKQKEEKHPIQYIQHSATAAILSAYDTKTAKHRRNRMMLILLYDTGARVQELADLNLSSLHFEMQNPYVTLIGKGRKSRNVPLMDKTVRHLKVYLKEFHPEDIEEPLFYSLLDGKSHRLATDSISLVLKTAADIARNTCVDIPDNVHCHLIRKTKAMDLYKNGVPLPFIMQLLGHESMSTTSGFYAFATLEMMSRAMTQAGPKVDEKEKLWKKADIRKSLFTLD